MSAQQYLVITAHPNPKSFNSAIAESVINVLKENKKDFAVRDLYRINFNPALSFEDLTAMYNGSCVEDVQIEREYVKSADILIFVFPVIFNNLPAMLKGYLDRVYSLGFGWGMKNNRPLPLLTGKKAIIFSTTYSSNDLCKEFGLFEAVNKAIASALHQFCGIEPIEHKFFISVPLVTDDERKKMLEEARKIIRGHL